MVNISKISRIKVIDNSAENLNKARLKCEEARKYIGLALENDDKNNLLKAVDLYIESIEIYSRSVEPYLAIADICWQFGQLEDSIGLLNKVLDIESGQPNAIKMLAKLNSELFNKVKTSHIAKIADKALSERSEDITKNSSGNLISKVSFPVNKVPGPIFPNKSDNYSGFLQQAKRISDEKKNQ